MSDQPHLEEAGPEVYRGDLFTHTRTGQSGVVERVNPGGVVDVELFGGASLPNSAAGRAARSLGVTASADFRTRDTLTVDSIQVRRPAIGTRFELHPMRPNSGSGEVEVQRVLTNGYVAVVDIADRSLVLQVHSTELYDDAEDRRQADPSKWPIVQL